MFAGHIGAALAIGRVERRVNVGVFVVGALWLDLVLWLLVLMGVETVSIPARFIETHQAEFVFPFSHGLAAALLWSALAGALGWIAWRRLGESRGLAAALTAATVGSHWLIDALVHRPELPLIGATSLKVGLGLWDHVFVALGIEAGLVVLGLVLFATGSGWSRGRANTLVVLTILLLAFTAVGMTAAPPPPSSFAMAASSLATLVIVCGLYLWLGRRKRSGAQD